MGGYRITYKVKDLDAQFIDFISTGPGQPSLPPDIWWRQVGSRDSSWSTKQILSVEKVL